MLKISEKFEIRSDDELNYGLYELKEVRDKTTKQKRQEWIHIGYFGKVSHALSAALDKYIRGVIGTEDMTCRDLLNRLEQIENDLDRVNIKYPSKIKSFKGINSKKEGGKKGNGTREQAFGRDDGRQGEQDVCGPEKGV